MQGSLAAAARLMCRAATHWLHGLELIGLWQGQTQLVQLLFVHATHVVLQAAFEVFAIVGRCIFQPANDLQQELALSNSCIG